MADAVGLVEKIKKAAKEAQEATKPVNVYFGEVVSTVPLKINVEQKMILGEVQLILTRAVTDYTIRATLLSETEQDVVSDQTHSQVLVHNALEIGDEVLLIRQQEGQRFVVVDRIGGRK